MAATTRTSTVCSAIAAEAFEFLFLQDAQEFGLQLERDVADFVQEKGAAIGELEAADFLVDGAGEGAAFVAEEFGFEQAGGNRGAIHFDEGALFARAEIVDGARDEFFAGAGFAEDENGAAGGRDEFDLRQTRANGGAVADDFFEIVGAANFFFEVELFFGEFVFSASICLKAMAFSTAMAICAATCCDELDVGGRESRRRGGWRD